MYLIGTIIKPHGIRGEVKIKVHSDFNRFERDMKVIINNNEYVVESKRIQNEILLVKFVSIKNRNDAELLKGLDVFTNENTDELKENEFHFSSLIGLEVWEKDTKIGEVTEVMEVPQGHILVIKGSKPRILIPFINNFIVEVTEDKILVDLPEGLIWK